MKDCYQLKVNETYIILYKRTKKNKKKKSSSKINNKKKRVKYFVEQCEEIERNSFLYDKLFDKKRFQAS